MAILDRRSATCFSIVSRSQPISTETASAALFVGEIDGEICTSCLVGHDGHRGWLYAVAVSPDHRRRGIGTALVNFTLDALREIGCKKVNLQIRADNTAVAEFYNALGFSAEDRMSMGTFI